MSSRHRRAVAGLLLMAALGGAAWLAGFAPHTDDGCQVETHCLACRSAYARPTVVAPAHSVTVVLVAVGATVSARPAPVADGLRSLVSSRGPPLFA